MTHKSNLVMWSLRPIGDNVLLFEAGIQSERSFTRCYATFKNGVRIAFETLVVYIHLN